MADRARSKVCVSARSRAGAMFQCSSYSLAHDLTNRGSTAPLRPFFRALLGLSRLSRNSNDPLNTRTQNLEWFVFFLCLQQGHSIDARRTGGPCQPMDPSARPRFAWPRPAGACGAPSAPALASPRRAKIPSALPLCVARGLDCAAIASEPSRASLSNQAVWIHAPIVSPLHPLPHRHSASRRSGFAWREHASHPGRGDQSVGRPSSLLKGLPAKSATLLRPTPQHVVRVVTTRRGGGPGRRGRWWRAARGDPSGDPRGGGRGGDDGSGGGG